MSRLETLRSLMAALAGEAPAVRDWRPVVELANAALVTPQLHAALVQSGAAAALPASIAAFTAEVLRRNRRRNWRLMKTLIDGVRALNAAGLEPVLLKGAALWAALDRPTPFDRMMNDLDLLVRPAEGQQAIAALVQSGFELASAYSGPRTAVVAELGRPTDVGYIDLHQRPPGPPGLAEVDDLRARCRPVRWAGVRAWVPAPHLQAWFLVLHDQFDDGDYWRGGFTLRHLLDLALLAREEVALDWPALAALARTPLAAHALGAELAAAADLAGAPVPRMLIGPWARLQYARHLAQFRWPRLGTGLAAVAMAADGPAILQHRAAERAAQRRILGAPSPGLSLAGRMARMRYILAGLADGKI